MKKFFLLISVFVFSGCYTKLQLPNYSKNDYSSYSPYLRGQSYYDGDLSYQLDYDDGYDQALRVFTNWDVADRWNVYYNRFYWVDSYWGSRMYDPFLWDPYFGYYGSWGLSYYYGYPFNNFYAYGYWMSPYPYSPFFRYSGYFYRANNLVFIHNDNKNSKGTKWSYGPRNFGTSMMIPVSGSGGIYKTNTRTSGSNNAVPRVNVRGSRTGNNSASSNGSGFRNNTTTSTSGSSNTSSGSSSNARPSRTGNH